MPEERHFRAFGRRAAALSAALADPAGAARSAQVVNIGLGGACVELRDAAPPPVGSGVTLELFSPGLWDPLHLPARIAWTRTMAPNLFRAGLAFQHTGPGALSGLVELLGPFR